MHLDAEDPITELSVDPHGSFTPRWHLELSKSHNVSIHTTRTSEISRNNLHKICILKCLVMFGYVWCCLTGTVPQALPVLVILGGPLSQQMLTVRRCPPVSTGSRLPDLPGSREFLARAADGRRWPQMAAVGMWGC